MKKRANKESMSMLKKELDDMAVIAKIERPMKHKLFKFLAAGIQMYIEWMKLG